MTKNSTGPPSVAAEPDGAHAQIFREIAARVRDGFMAAGRPAPKIVIEA